MGSGRDYHPICPVHMRVIYCSLNTSSLGNTHNQPIRRRLIDFQTTVAPP